MDLIQITTGEQGLSVVAARELYDFLGFDSSQWARWSKKNIVDNPYSKQGEDWQGFDIMSNGNRSTDFTLSLDFAKRLSMLARTEKGEQIRHYFLACERQLQQQQDPILLRLAQHEQRINQLEQQLAQFLQPQPAEDPLLDSPTPVSCRMKVTQLINQHATQTQTAHYMVWNEVYNRLHALYGFNVRAHKKFAGESWIDVAERHNQVERIYAIVQAEINHCED